MKTNWLEEQLSGGDCSLCNTPLNRSQSDCWLTDKEDRSVYVSQECDVQMQRLMVLLICIYTCMRVPVQHTLVFEVSEPLFDLLPDFLVFRTDIVAVLTWNYCCSPTWHSRPRIDRLTGCSRKTHQWANRFWHISRSLSTKSMLPNCPRFSDVSVSLLPRPYGPLHQQDSCSAAW